MKTFLLVLLVCVASTYAANPFQDILSNVQGVVQNLISNIVGQLLSTINVSLKPRADLSAILNAFQSLLGSVGQNFVQEIANTLFGLTTQILNPLVGGSKVNVNIESRIKDQVNELLSTISILVSSLAQNLFSNLVGKRDFFGQLLANLNLEQLGQQLQTQLLSMIGNFLSGISRSNKGVIDYLAELFNIQGVINTVSQIGGQLYSQFLNVATQLLFAGQQVWQQAQPVFNNLVSELTNHAGNAVQLVSQAVLQLTSVLNNGKVPQTKGFLDTIFASLGLDGLLNQVQSVGTALYSQLIAIGTQLLFAGQQMWQQALPVFQNLGSELTNHAGNAVQLVSQAVLQLTSVLANGNNARSERGIIDTIMNAFGLNQIFSQVSQVGTALYSQFVAIATQLLFAGQQMWQQAQPVFNNLVSELTNHAGNAVQLVSQAVLQLTSVLANGNNARSLSQRGLIDTLLGLFNLEGVFSQISSVGSALYSQFLNIATQLLFAGQQMWQQAQPVFNNLVSELTNHAGNAVQLVSQAVLQLTSVLSNGSRTQKAGILDWIASAFNLDGVFSQISSVGTALFSQFTALATQLLFAGQQMWQQAQPVFNNLVSELTNHAGNAVQLVSQAVLQLTSVLNNGRTVQKFNPFEWIASAFNLDGVFSQISSVGTALFSQFTSIATQLLFAGQQMWQQAQPVFNNLVSELTNHAGNAVQLVSQAVLQLTSVLANGNNRNVARLDFIELIMNTFGLGSVVSQIQSVGTALYSQVIAIGTQLLFAGQQMWQQALPVFNNLVSELTNHAGNAVQLVSQAVLQLTSVLANGN